MLAEDVVRHLPALPPTFPHHVPAAEVEQDPASFGESERGRVLGAVPHVVQLFSGTVFDNVTLGDPLVSQEDVHEAATFGGADVFIRALPQGFRMRLSGTASGA